MKRVFSKQVLQNKWVVPFSALVLTFAIGSFAFAGTGANESPYSYTSQSIPSTTTTTFPTMSTSTTTASFPTLDLPAYVSPTTTSTMLTAEDLALQQAKENAILDLIREKMVPEDQVVFDQLRVVAVQQQVALSKAQADLQTTKLLISALINKYLGVPEDIGSTLVTGADAVTGSDQSLLPTTSTTWKKTMPD